MGHAGHTSQTLTSTKDASHTSRHVRHTRAAKGQAPKETRSGSACSLVDDFLAGLTPHLDLEDTPDAITDMLRATVCAGL